MSQPTPKIAFPSVSHPPLTTDSPAAGRAASPYRTVPNRYMEPQLLPDSDYRLDDTLTEEAGMARNPGALGAYAGSF